jgi:hypothetical protein
MENLRVTLPATIRVENSFATTITDTKFVNCSTAIEFANTDTWSEYNKIENCQFINATEGIARTCSKQHAPMPAHR